jgi:hypothetical protein
MYLAKGMSASLSKLLVYQAHSSSLPISQVSIKRIMAHLALNLQNLKQISKGVSKMLRFVLTLNLLTWKIW